MKKPFPAEWARHASEAKYPSLWRGLRGLWVPPVQIRGGASDLVDLTGRGQTFTVTASNVGETTTPLAKTLSITSPAGGWQVAASDILALDNSTAGTIVYCFQYRVFDNYTDLIRGDQSGSNSYVSILGDNTSGIMYANGSYQISLTWSTAFVAGGYYSLVVRNAPGWPGNDLSVFQNGVVINTKSALTNTFQFEYVDEVQTNVFSIATYDRPLHNIEIALWNNDFFAAVRKDEFVPFPAVVVGGATPQLVNGGLVNAGLINTGLAA